MHKSYMNSTIDIIYIDGTEPDLNAECEVIFVPDGGLKFCIEGDNVTYYCTTYGEGHWLVEYKFIDSIKLHKGTLHRLHKDSPFLEGYWEDEDKGFWRIRLIK